MLPREVRIIGWFYTVGAVVGALAGAIEWWMDARAGTYTIVVPLGLGISAWAIGRGLLAGSPRAWRWARRIAVAAVPLTALGAFLALLVPENTELTLPFMEPVAQPSTLLILSVGVASLAFWGWHLVVLHRDSTRRAFGRRGGG